MRRRWLSLDVKFPALMTGIVLLIGAVFMWSSHRAFGLILRETSGARLASSAALLAGVIRDGVPAARIELMRLAALDEVRHALDSGEDSARVARVLLSTMTRSSDSSLLRVRLIDAKGVTRHTLPVFDGPLAPSWVEGARARGELSPLQPTFSPVLAADGQPQVEYIVPVHSRPGGESLIGYLVQTRRLRGRGAEAVRKLIGTSTMLFGQPEAGAWSDLEQVVEGPPPIVALDSVFQFDQSPRGAGIGVASPIRGTPWVVWLQLSEAQVMAPVNAFLWRMTPIMIVVAMLGAALAWLFSRRISGRVMRLTQKVDRMSVKSSPSGQTAAAPDSRDEIERLEDAFRLLSERALVQQQLEAQLQQSQKLEAVGRLAGGIAHDFNNVLTVVTNFGEIIQSDLEPNSDTARDLDQILKAANRAAGLTRQLLAFSRRQILQPVRLDVNDSVRGASTMLERLLPSRVSITLELDPSIRPVMADPVQIEQVLLNLAVNASDAMPNGGRLTIRSMMAELDQMTPGADEEEAREHVCLVVKDSGVGMDRETANRIFEPFFTTKPIGKGTGLGLASVHGIVTQLGGRVWVYSEPGKGTTFKLYLPAVEGEAAPLERGRVRTELPRGSGTVLLVEDDPGTRDVTHRLLTRQGYAVLGAHTADDALHMLADQSHDIRLVLTDVMMPGMNGVEFAKRVGAEWPDMPILLMSGYSDTEVIDESDIVRYRFLEKPFTSASLLSAVAAAIGSLPAATSADATK